MATFTGFVSVNTEGAVEKFAKKVLGHMASMMPGGLMWDSHNNGEVDHAHAIAMTVRGETICLRKGNCSCNSIHLLPTKDIKQTEDGQDIKVYLSTSSTGPVWYWKGTWEESLEAYNESVAYNENYGGVITGLFIF